MRETGLFNPISGYWQTVGAEPDLSNYPAGTVKVPLRPGPKHEWDGGKWVIPPANPAEEAAEQARLGRIAASRATLASVLGLEVDEIKEALGLI